MIGFLDVGYPSTGGALSALGIAEDWSSLTFHKTLTKTFSDVASYESGKFYLRELPCLLGVIQPSITDIKVLVVDGNVWLDDGKDGLGAHLWRHYHEKIPVVGIAKSSFHRGVAKPVFRETSKNPLWVSSAGLSIEEAVKFVGSMAGKYRIPTLCKEIDRISKTK